MERLMERLDRKITWTLVPPCPAGGNQSLMQRVEKARNASAGLAPEPEEADLRFAAAGAWHLVATDVADTVAGALRMNIIDRREGPRVEIRWGVREWHVWIIADVSLSVFCKAQL